MKKSKFILPITILVIFLTSCKPDPINPPDDLEYKNISLVSEITKVQPMTGIVYFSNNTSTSTYAETISLEFSYLNFNDIVTEEGIYDWTVAENLLNTISSKKHQAVLRFRYSFPGKETTVPDYIKARDDYNEIIGTSEGQQTHFPDWTCAELERFTKEFHTKFSEKYDNDPRLAFIEVGFGLWAEYHIYSGPFELGVTFPTKDFQEEFFYHLGSTYSKLQWLVGINSIDATYSPLEAKPQIKNDNNFGLFDDSFMHATHYAYNESLWLKFGMDRYKTAPMGGEFSYYSTYDQQHVLDLPDGAYGKSWEQFASKFHMTFILGNDQPNYQTPERIKQASMGAGYHFKIITFKASSDKVVIEVKNTGVAQIYYDAFISINGNRSSKTLKNLLPGNTQTDTIEFSGNTPELKIESDHILSTQEIQFEANL